MNTRLKIYQRMINMMVILALSFLQVVPTAHAIGEYDYMNQDNLNEEAITEEVLDENPSLSEEVGEILQDDEINHVIDTHTHKTTIKKDSDMMDLSADEEVDVSTFDTKVKSNLTNSNEAMIANRMSTTSTYKMATDADFSGTTNGSFRYIGTDEYVEIPHRIKGVNVTSYDRMFQHTSVKGVKSTNKNITNMRWMFYNTKATSLDVRNLDTSNVTNMTYMFRDSQATSLDVSNLNTSKVTEMGYMFHGSQATSIDLRGIDTSNVWDMGNMFSRSQATSLDLRGLDTSSVTYMPTMFGESKATSIDLSGIDTSRVTDMVAMFRNSQATILDLRSFDTSKATKMGAMFYQSKATIGYARTKFDADIFNGTSNKPTSLTFYVYEGVPPTGTITGNPTSWTKNNITLTFNASDASGVSRVQKPGGTWVNGSSTTHTVSSNGTYTFKAEDIFGNTGTFSVTVNRIDKTLPTVSFGTNGNSTARKSHSTTVNVADSGGSGVSTRQYQWSTSTATPTGTWTNFSNGQTITRSSGTGNYYLHIRATDSAGNVRNSRTNAFNLDNTAPTTPTLTASTTAWTKGNVTVTGTYPSDATVKQYRIGSGSWTNYTAPFAVSSNVTVQARAQDSAGNWSTTRSLVISNIDKTLPNGSIAGNPTAWTNSNPTLTFTATDSGGSGVRRVRIKDGAWVNGATTTRSVSANGTYTFTVEDNAGNTRDVSVTVNRIDKTLPNGTITGNPTSWTNSNVTLNFTATDSGGSGVSRVRNHSGTWTSGSITSQTVSSNGTYTFRVEDGAGNIRDVSVTVNRIDKTSPTVTFGTNGSSTASNSHSTTVNVTDAGSGVSTRQYQWTTSTATPTSGTWTSFTNGATITRNSGNGNYYLHIRSTDVAGNTRNTRTNAFNLDTTAPTAPTLSSSTTGWTNGNVTVTATYPTDAVVKQYKIGSGSWLTYTTPIAISSNSTVYARGRDSAGNWSTERSLAISNMDKTLPNGTITGNPTSWRNSNATLTFNATDSGGSGVKRVRIKDGTWVNGSTTTQTATANGTYTFTVEDNAGNTREVSVTVNRIDKALPNGTITGNPTSWTKSNQTLTFKATDTGGSGVRRVRVKDGSWVSGSTTTLAVSSNGTYVFTVEDNAGNTREVSVVVNRIDKTLPTVSFGTNGNSTASQSHSTTVSISDTGSGVASSQYQWTSSTATPTSGTWTSFTNGATITRNTGTGNIYLHVRVTDNVGNVRNIRTNAFSMDNTPPTVPTLSASTTGWTNSNVAVTITYPSDATVKQYRIGSGSWPNYSSAVTMSSNGTVQARAQDSAGNWSAVGSVNVTNIDKTVPNGSITGNPTSWTNSNATLTFNATDSGGSGVRRVRVKGGNWVNGTTTTQVATQNGSYAFEVEDNAGNIREVSVNVNRIDKTKPSITVTGNPSQQTSQDVTLTISASDDESGIQSIRLPNNQIVNGNTATFIVAENGSYTFIVIDKAGNQTQHTEVVENIKKEVPLAISVTNSTGVGLSGASFELYRNGVLQKTAISQLNGSVDFGDVAIVGDYHILQTVVPEGYRLMRDKILIETEGTNPTIINYKESEMMPGTGTTELLPYISIIVIAGAFTSFIETKKRSKR